jgi:hypothetical protein
MFCLNAMMAILKAWQAQAIAPAEEHMQKMASIKSLLPLRY